MFNVISPKMKVKLDDESPQGTYNIKKDNEFYFKWTTVMSGCCINSN